MLFGNAAKRQSVVGGLIREFGHSVSASLASVSRYLMARKATSIQWKHLSQAATGKVFDTACRQCLRTFFLQVTSCNSLQFRKLLREVGLKRMLCKFGVGISTQLHDLRYMSFSPSAMFRYQAVAEDPRLEDVRLVSIMSPRQPVICESSVRMRRRICRSMLSSAFRA